MLSTPHIICRFTNRAPHGTRHLRFHRLQALRGCSSRMSVASRVKSSLLLGMIFSPAVKHALRPSCIIKSATFSSDSYHGRIQLQAGYTRNRHGHGHSAWYRLLSAPQRSARLHQHHVTNNRATRNNFFHKAHRRQPSHCHHARPGNWSASRSCCVFLPREIGCPAAVLPSTSIFTQGLLYFSCLRPAHARHTGTTSQGHRSQISCQ